MTPCALVASTTFARRPPASALPTITSDSPSEYTSAVSTKLIPESSALWMIAMLWSWSGLPQVLPNIIAPRQNGLTRTPVEPSTRVVMFATLWGLVGRLSDGRCPGRSRLLRRRTTLPLSALPGKVAARLSGAANLSRWLASLGGSSGLAVPATVGHPALVAAWQDRTAAREALHVEPVVERFLG